MDEQPLNAGILDLATYKMCGGPYHCGPRWALTPPFHPYRPMLSGRPAGGNFLSHYSAVSGSFPLGNIVLCVARTFLNSPGLAASLQRRNPGPDAYVSCIYRNSKIGGFCRRFLHISSDDTAFGVTHEKDDFIALLGGGQLGLDALDGVGDVHARQVEIAVDFLNVADSIV